MLNPSRLTKAQLIAVLQDQQAALSQGPSWEQIADKVIRTAQTVSRETVALGIDIMKLGALSRQWVSRVVDELSRPVLRSDA